MAEMDAGGHAAHELRILLSCRQLPTGLVADRMMRTIVEENRKDKDVP